MQKKAEPAKLRVLRASCCTCSHASRASCPTCSCAPRAWCHTCSRASLASRSTCLVLQLPRALGGLVPRTFFPTHPAVSYFAYSNSSLVLLNFNASRSYFSVYLLIVIFFQGIY